MKTVLFILFIILAIVVILQSLVMASVNKTREQVYKVIQKDQNFEIRFYPAATLATIRMNAKSYRDLSGPGFRKLAGYIFGGNVDKTQIPMTAPVHMDINDTLSSMSFVMPSPYNQSNLPKPNNPDVILETKGDEYVAAIRFGGFASDEKLKFYSEKLQEILREKGIKSVGNPRFFGYNPPYQLVGRRNEIIVAIEWK